MFIPNNYQRSKQKQGITLLEVTISILLVGLLMVSTLRVTGGALRTWYAIRTQYDRTMLANQLLDEVLQTSYQDPDGSVKFGMESDESQGPTHRNELDDIDDYVDWNELAPSFNDGTAISGFAGWSRTVEVIRLFSDDYQTEVTHHSNDYGLRLIRVTVTDPQGNQTSVSSFRTSAGNPLISKGVDTNIVTWMGCELQLGASGEKVTSGSYVLNYANN